MGRLQRGSGQGPALIWPRSGNCVRAQDSSQLAYIISVGVIKALFEYAHGICFKAVIFSVSLLFILPTLKASPLPPTLYWWITALLTKITYRKQIVPSVSIPFANVRERQEQRLAF